MKIRLAQEEDKAGIKKILNSIELFPAELLDGMMHPYLTESDCQDIWFTAVNDGEILAFGYCAPEMLTEGTYNLYAIGILNEQQGLGIGTQMMTFLESKLLEKKQRILIIETSGIESFNSTRKFYEKLNFTREATIRDFWDEGDDKVIYWKKLV